MLNKASSTWRTAFTKVFVAAVVMLALVFVPIVSAQAAAKAPTISKKTLNVLVKNTYDLNIKNKVSGSTYAWSSSNEKIATVDRVGLVKGKSRGDVVITCKVMTPSKKVYTLTSKVKVVSGAKGFAISNKIAVLNKGQVYDVNRTLKPFTSNDVTTWTSSDTSIAKPDKKGKFTALKAGTVTITGKTLSGKSDSMTVKIIDAEGVVATQAEMEELLKAGASKITLRTDKEVTFTIPEGNYEKVALVVDAPKADIYNYGVFKSIDIFRVAPSTFHEHAKGNKLVIRSEAASIEVADNASVSIEITSEGAKVTIKNDNGDITGVVMMSAADLKIEGKSEKAIPVEVKAKGASITTSTPLAVKAEAPTTLTLEKGAESTTVAADKKDNIPTVYGNVTISVTVGTGATQEKVEVKGQEIKVDQPTTPPVTGGGTPSGGDTPQDSGYTKYTVNGKTRYTLTKQVAQITRIEISFMDFPIKIDGEMLTTLLGFLNDPTVLDKWRASNTVTKTYGVDGNEFEITASAATGDTRTITLVKTPFGLLDGRQYTVKLDTVNLERKTGSFTITGSTNYLKISKLNDTTLEVDTNITGLNFVPKFN